MGRGEPPLSFCIDVWYNQFCKQGLEGGMKWTLLSGQAMRNLTTECAP